MLRITAQAFALFWELVWAITRATAYIPYAIIYITIHRLLGIVNPPLSEQGAVFYKGLVFHTRKRPKENSFTYPVRLAIVDLDNPPSWWRRGKKDSMTADEARALAGTNGPVKLLTNPTAAGYYQNPISVYYCYSSETAPAMKPVARALSSPGSNTENNASTPLHRYKTRSRAVELDNDDELSQQHSGLDNQHHKKPQPAVAMEDCILVKCLSEVTNTPWGERVTFAFDPKGQQVPKSLHVSPFMDMKNIWTITSTAPDSHKLKLTVAAQHPEHGNYFVATLQCSIDTAAPHTLNELAGFQTLLEYGFQPQRIAFWIYLQAVVLLWKGVRFYAPPGEEYKEQVEKKGGKKEKLADGRVFAWRSALGWPWK